LTVAITMNTLNLLPVLPEILVLASACVILLVDVFLPDRKRHVGYWLTQITLLSCASFTLTTMQAQPVLAFNALVVDDVL